MGSKIPFLQRDPPLHKISVTYALSRPQARRLHIGRAGNKHTHRKVSLQRRMQAVAALQNAQRLLDLVIFLPVHGEQHTALAALRQGLHHGVKVRLIHAGVLL